jgi:hypothetical protein
MPSYIVVAGRGGYDGNPCCRDNSVDRNSAIFFNNLANKLLEMSKAIDARMTELSNRVCAPETKGFLFASIETPQMVLGVKYEFVEYIKRYGPPVNGKFDAQKLEDIRIELGISAAPTIT